METKEKTGRQREIFTILRHHSKYCICLKAARLFRASKRFTKLYRLNYDLEDTKRSDNCMVCVWCVCWGAYFSVLFKLVWMVGVNDLHLRKTFSKSVGNQ